MWTLLSNVFDENFIIELMKLSLYIDNYKIYIITLVNRVGILNNKTKLILRRDMYASAYMQF